MTFEKISIHPINLEKAKNNLKKFSPTEKEYQSVLDWIRQLTIEKGLKSSC